MELSKKWIRRLRIANICDLLWAAIANRLHLPQSPGVAPHRPSVPSSPSFVLFVVVVVFVFLVYGGMRALERRGIIRQGRRRRRHSATPPPPRSGVDAASPPASFLFRGVVPPLPLPRPPPPPSRQVHGRPAAGKRGPYRCCLRRPAVALVQVLGVVITTIVAVS